METVKNADIKKDCIYFATPKSGKGDHYIFRCGNPSGWKSFVIDRGVFGREGTENWLWSDYNLRMPTTEEADWLVMCEQAGKFVPKPLSTSAEVINHYEIY